MYSTVTLMTFCKFLYLKNINLIFIPIGLHGLTKNTLIWFVTVNNFKNELIFHYLQYIQAKIQQVSVLSLIIKKLPEQNLIGLKVTGLQIDIMGVAIKNRRHAFSCHIKHKSIRCHELRLIVPIF